jgi:hypothetical protein
MVSVERLFHYFLGHAKSLLSLDHQLVMDAIKVHEDGEALLKRDVLLHNKTLSGHVDEYMAFKGMLVGNPDYITRMRKAFLLQFVLDEGFEIPGDHNANFLLKKLRKDNQHEAMIFNLLERFDYYLYAVRAYDKVGDVVILVHVLRNNWRFLDSYSRLIPGIANIWTGELHKTVLEFLQEYKDIPGPKDEGGIPAAYAYAVEKGYMTI